MANSKISMLDYEPVKKFVQSLGPGVERYFGNDKACIVYLQPDGIFYGEGLFQWLQKRRMSV